MVAKALAVRGIQSMGNHPPLHPIVKFSLEDTNVGRKDRQNQHWGIS